MIELQDQIGRYISLSKHPKRIISTVPSITETLIDLGLGGKIAGRTKYCINPKDKVKHIPVIGGTKNLIIERIKNLRPDLIIANKEENVQEQIDDLVRDVTCYVSDVKSISDVIQLITDLGRLCDTAEAAQAYINELQSKANDPIPSSLPTAYLIWRRPYMTVGADTYIHHMLYRAGFENVYKNEIRYPTLDIDELKERNPSVVMLSSEPYPFKKRHMDELQLALPESKIILVDGELCSWYGTRTTLGMRYLWKLREELLVELAPKKQR